MDSFRRTLARGGLVAVLATSGIAVAGAASTSQEAAAKPAVQAAPHGEYAGTAACLSCHEGLAAATTTGPHSHAFRAGTPMSPKGCQECHGDTKAALGCEAGSPNCRCWLASPTICERASSDTARWLTMYQMSSGPWT